MPRRFGVTYPAYKPPAARPSPKPKPFQVGGFVQPPPLTYDPAIEATRQAAIRGEHDLQREVHTGLHEGKQDLAQALRNIHTKTARSRQDTGISYQQGVQKLGYSREDTQQHAARSQADFVTQLHNIGTQFTQLGHRQTESANAAGVLDAGTQAASAAARAQNQGLAEAPIHTAQGRLSEDLATALRRNDTAGGELGEARDRSLTRLGQDRNRERRLDRQTTNREAKKLTTKGQIGKREVNFSNLNAIEQEIYNARQQHPAAFSKTGRKKK